MSVDPSFVPTTPDEMAACLADPMWRVCSGQLYKIMVKTEDASGSFVVPFKPNRAQLQLLSRLWHRNIILKARQLGFCLDPSTRVLTDDLRWVRIDSLAPGQRVISVDEHPPGGRGKARKMRTASVVAVKTVHRKAFRITFDDGRTVVCTTQHPWLTRNAKKDPRWRSIDGTGNAVEGEIKVGTQVRWVASPWTDPTVEDGWFGGMIDGEGSLANSKRTGGSISIAQRPGAVLDRMVAYAEARGYSYRIEDDATERKSKFGRTPVPKLAFTRMDELFRLIGQTRPTRFIGRAWWEDRELPGKRNGGVGWATIVKIEELGDQPMIDLQTTTGTYIAEGFVSHNTTLIAILWLDHALFVADQRCGIIAQDREAAEAIFRDKVKFAYDNLPDPIKAMFQLARDSASELLFEHNNSAIRVATSMRSGTIHRLHVSEFGKIGAKFPDKAVEVVTGSLPAVPLDGVAIIESTAEGQDGEFYRMTKQAQADAEAKRALTKREYRFHFFPWHANPEYEIDPEGVVITAKDHQAFDEIEAQIGRKLTIRQRAWYCATRKGDFAGDPEKMWQEYPSTPDEAFKVSTEGTYYAVQLTAARQQGRICRVPFVTGVPVNTFWDIGNSDGTAIWFHQRVGPEHRWINFMEGWGEPYAHFVKRMQETDYIWGTHFLPHDADHKRQGSHANKSPKDMLEALAPGWRFQTVERIDEVIHGIQMVRDAFSQCWFDEVNCAAGITHLSLYRKEWNTRLATWSDRPRHDVHSEAADALRQFAQAWDDGVMNAGATLKRRNRSGMAA